MKKDPRVYLAQILERIDRIREYTIDGKAGFFSCQPSSHYAKYSKIEKYRCVETHRFQKNRILGGDRLIRVIKREIK